jgi:hypothetical protein
MPKLPDNTITVFGAVISLLVLIGPQLFMLIIRRRGIVHNYWTEWTSLPRTNIWQLLFLFTKASTYLSMLIIICQVSLHPDGDDPTSKLDSISAFIALPNIWSRILSYIIVYDCCVVITVSNIMALRLLDGRRFILMFISLGAFIILLITTVPLDHPGNREPVRYIEVAPGGNSTSFQAGIISNEMHFGIIITGVVTTLVGSCLLLFYGVRFPIPVNQYTFPVVLIVNAFLFFLVFRHVTGKKAYIQSVSIFSETCALLLISFVRDALIYSFLGDVMPGFVDQAADQHHVHPAVVPPAKPAVESAAEPAAEPALLNQRSLRPRNGKGQGSNRGAK